MNTAAGLAYKGESFDDGPEYLIPERIPIENREGSQAVQSDLDNPPLTELALDDIIVAPRYLSPLKGKFNLLQLWEGRVIDIRNDEFDAIISDKTNSDFPDELVTIDAVEITPDDLPLLKKGAVFYWSVGYLDYPGRGRARESKIRFRRLKGWTEKEIEHARRIGNQFAQFFKQDPICSPKM